MKRIFGMMFLTFVIAVAGFAQVQFPASHAAAAACCAGSTCPMSNGSCTHCTSAQCTSCGQTCTMCGSGSAHK